MFSVVQCSDVMSSLCCSNVVKMFATAEGLLTQQDRVNKDGLQEVFATNLFGHFVLVSHLSYFILSYHNVSQHREVCLKWKHTLEIKT